MTINQNDKGEMNRETQIAIRYLKKDENVRRFISELKQLLCWDDKQKIYPHLVGLKTGTVKSVEEIIGNRFMETLSKIHIQVQPEDMWEDLLEAVIVSRIDYHAIAEYLLENVK